MKNDITKEKYARWLEDTLKQLLLFDPRSIALVAISGEETATNYFMCDACDLAQMGAILEQDGMMLRIENNREWLKSILEAENDN